VDVPSLEDHHRRTGAAPSAPFWRYRTDPALANAVLTDHAIALGIATPDVVEALSAACPTG